MLLNTQILISRGFDIVYIYAVESTINEKKNLEIKENFERTCFICTYRPQKVCLDTLDVCTIKCVSPERVCRGCSV